MAMAAADIPQQQQRYELVSTLGKGGMAEVFLGWMNSVGGLRRKVAIKRILPDLVQKQSRLFEQMFVDEARLAFQLEHDNIVRVYDVGQSANTFFIVMEYVEGMDLKKVYETLRNRGQRMPIGDAIYVAAQVSAGLAYAHDLTDEEGQAMGLVHNDISPPNILIGRYGEVKIADFGLSDARSNDVVTPEGMVKGKFAYISPESTRDPTLVSHRSDVFSTGIVLWEMLAGQRLFQKETDVKTFQAVRDCTIPDIRQVRSDVPPELASVLNRALSKEPEARYRTARELFEDLTGFSYKKGVPFNRYSLVNLVNSLTDQKWGGFAGEKVSEDQVNELQLELEGMLPPGVAAHLKTFVTGAKVADDVDESGLIQEDWVGAVFDDVGFDDDDVSPVGGFNDVPPEMRPDLGGQSQPASPLASAAPTPQAPAKKPAPPAVRTQAAAKTPAEKKPAAPATQAPTAPATSAGSQPQPNSSPQLNTDSMVQAMRSEIKSQRVTWIVWGAIGGIVLGSLLGFAIGALL